MLRISAFLRIIALAAQRHIAIHKLIVFGIKFGRYEALFFHRDID